MGRFRYLLPFLLAWEGCGPGKLAGTEVGNPEIVVTARFSIRENDSMPAIPAMSFKMMGLEYRTRQDSMRMIWDDPDGHMVAIASRHADSSLPNVILPYGGWKNCGVMLHPPPGDSSLPDTLAFIDLANPRYLKGMKMMKGEAMHFLFEMPRDLRFKLMFKEAKVASWARRGRDGQRDTLTVNVAFDCDKWMAGLPEGEFRTRKDGKGVPYILLDPAENGAAYEKLKALLPNCFNADSVITL